MSILRHLRLSVRGALLRTNAQLRREWEGAITTDAGKLFELVLIFETSS